MQEEKFIHWSDLEVWKKAHSLVLDIYKISKKLPNEENYGLVSQIKRAAYSIPVNIVEGCSRNSTKEFLQFLTISRGSLEELRYFLLLVQDLSYIDSNCYKNFEKQAIEVSKLLNGLIKSIRNKIK